jgi:glucan phosphoethanolaminetransferase (alkaline phosphatase superfamily)
MVRHKVHSAHSDLKTGFFSTFFIYLGIVLLGLYLVETLLRPIGLSETVTGALLAFAIICIGVGLLLYFLVLQFTKLSVIAKEIEADESLCDDEEEEPQKEKPIS